MHVRSRLMLVIENVEDDLLKDWVKEQLAAPMLRRELMSETELRDQSRTFLKLFRGVPSKDGLLSTDGSEWAKVKEFVSDISRSRAKQGFSPSETATFIFSLRLPLFRMLRSELTREPDQLFGELENAAAILDKLGLYSTEVYQKSREEIINRQQQEMLEVSTPVIRLWEGILALPLIGTLDSRRTQIAMEVLLQEIVVTGADVAIIDITGVPMVDTLVAQHLLKTVAATRLMGAECIISGIRPQIAQTMVHLSIDLGKVATKATLADAFLLALRRRSSSTSADDKSSSLFNQNSARGE
ncbi:MAG TPA: STAS domain-containing protein [Oligoflexus sp.]|uniref:STAS domain-containing protein n=1 Tax=Oligoflexus sp. TaxID=1971216 RepID=UPI002D49836E|nr:STAS domain-containing protein [Oligoflexus sp.]HYX37747.1 STAS domain-containing protein [Oligoflexus sp.]